MGYRQLLKKFMQEVELLLGTSLVEELALCHGLSPRELSELRVIAMELRDPNDEQPDFQRDADYHAVTVSLFDTFNVSIPQFLDACERELQAADRTLRQDPLEHVDLDTLRFVIAGIGRHYPTSARR